MPFNTQVEFQQVGLRIPHIELTNYLIYLFVFLLFFFVSQLKTFTQNYQESLYTIARHAVNNSLYQAERNVLWMEKNYRQVSGWLSKHYRYNN